jgi:Spy/CpxP family protein refolding chaperone
MNRIANQVVVCAGSLCLLAAVSQSAVAQRGGGARLFGAIPAVSLAQLEEVQQELKLTDEQKEKVEQLNEELNTARREAFQNAAGDFDKVREDVSKIYRESWTKFNAALEEPQQNRLREVFIQVNGPIVLSIEEVAGELMLSDEQKQKVEEAADDSRAEVFDSFQDFRNMSEEERAKKTQELIESRDTSLLAVLTDEQKEKLEKMKGEKLEVDLANLPGPGRR